jgi:hypothetical protein
MDVKKILAELRLEREQLEQAILTLERIGRERTGPEDTGAEPAKRRGRPPGRKSETKKRPDNSGNDSGTPG